MEYLENHLNDNSKEFDIPELEVRQVYTDADFVPVPEVSQSVMLYRSGDQTSDYDWGVYQSVSSGFIIVPVEYHGRVVDNHPDKIEADGVKEAEYRRSQ